MIFGSRQGVTANRRPEGSPSYSSSALTVLPSNSAYTVTPTMPTVVAGNLLIAIVCAASSTDATVSSFTSGWTHLGTNYNSGQEFGYYVYYKIAAGSDTFSMTFASVHARIVARVVQLTDANMVGMTSGSFDFSATSDPPYHAAADSGLNYFAMTFDLHRGTTTPSVLPSGFTSVGTSTTDYGYSDITFTLLYKDLGATEDVNPSEFTIASNHHVAATLIAYYL